MKQKAIWDYYQSQGLATFAQAAPRLRYLLEQADKRLNKPAPKLLNIGVGDGWLEQQAARLHWETHTVDPSEAAINKLRQRGLQAKVGKIESIPYEAEQFDVIICSEVLEHLTDEQLVNGLEEIARVLVTDGLLLGTVPYNESLQDNQAICPHCNLLFHKWGHTRSFDETALRGIFPARLRVEKIKICYFVHAASLNWKGLVTAYIKKLLSLLGVHGKNENLFFVARKCG